MSFPRPLTDKVTLLGDDYFNLYLLKGETCAILDGGVSALTNLVLKQLHELHVSFESISHLVILHSHFDHMMAFPPLLERFPWLKVVTSELNRPIFSDERIVNKIYDADRRITLGMMGKGLLSEAPTLCAKTPFPLDVPVAEGSKLSLGKGVEVIFLETPGHSPDSLSAHLETEGTLFCSDAAGFFIPPDFFRPNYWFSLEEAERSLRRMATMAPRMLCKGHYGAVEGREAVKYHLEKAHRSLKDFESLVLEKIQSGKSVEEISQEVTLKFSRGFLEFFPPEDAHRLWKLLIRRTLEHLGVEQEEKG